MITYQRMSVDKKRWTIHLKGNRVFDQCDLFKTRVLLPSRGPVRSTNPISVVPLS